jgi:hypothetical protein
MEDSLSGLAVEMEKRRNGIVKIERDFFLFCSLQVGFVRDDD